MPPATFWSDKRAHRSKHSMKPAELDDTNTSIAKRSTPNVVEIKEGRKQTIKIYLRKMLNFRENEKHS